MAATSNRPEEGGEGRVQCLYCGANNFPSSPTCWQCGRPLQAIRSQPRASQPGANRAEALPFRQPGPAASSDPVSPSLAPKAAAALGLTFPYLGLPVGIVFLMLDDERKTQIGWITIGWSVAGSIISALILLATLGPTLALLKSLVPGGHGGLPGLPSPGGEPSDLNMILPCLWQNLQGIVQASWHKLAFYPPCSRV